MTEGHPFLWQPSCQCIGICKVINPLGCAKIRVDRKFLTQRVEFEAAWEVNESQQFLCGCRVSRLRLQENISAVADGALLSVLYMWWNYSPGCQAGVCVQVLKLLHQKEIQKGVFVILDISDSKNSRSSTTFCWAALVHLETLCLQCSQFLWLRTGLLFQIQDRISIRWSYNWFSLPKFPVDSRAAETFNEVCWHSLMHQLRDGEISPSENMRMSHRKAEVSWFDCCRASLKLAFKMSLLVV